MPPNITSDVVEAMASHLHRAAGPCSTDAIKLHKWLLQFWMASHQLREELIWWAMWLSTHSRPWAAYWALMARHLIALDKQLGVWPISIREVYQ